MNAIHTLIESLNSHLTDVVRSTITDIGLMRAHETMRNLDQEYARENPGGTENV